MESRSKKARSHGGGPSSCAPLPHDILRFNILPRLSFKSLARFKSVSKSWDALISGDSLFAADQSLHPSPTSSGFVYLGSSGLEFLSAPDTPIGVPQPSLTIPFPSYRLKLLASTNGLLCCHVAVPDFDRFDDEHFPRFNLLYVFNPATQVVHVVPATRSRYLFVGLAFDPSNSEGRYTLVCLRPVVEGYIKTLCQFHVFSSDIRQWVVSSQRVVVDGLMSCQSTAVFAGGVLYWDCRRCLIWFDPSKKLAGQMPLPEKPSRASRHQLGVWEGRVLTCTQTWNEKVEVFVMENGSNGNWVRRHVASFDTEMVRGNLDVFARFCHPMRLRSKSFCDRLLSRWLVRPLALDGGDKLYLGVTPKRFKSKEKEIIRVLCYDLRTGEVKSISDGVRFLSSEGRVLSYHNSMVRVPRLGRRR